MSFIIHKTRIYEDIPQLLGKTMKRVEKRSDEEHGDELWFITVDDRKYKFFHLQDCGEYVNLEDICGNLADLVGAPLIQAEVASQHSDNDNCELKARDDSTTWTFYRFATIKGYVTVRWCGSSNGYYSEAVDFTEIK